MVFWINPSRSRSEDPTNAEARVTSFTALSTATELKGMVTSKGERTNDRS